jgi:hypothetical protein
MDSSKYSCVASNPAGEDAESYQLSVQGGWISVCVFNTECVFMNICGQAGQSVGQWPVLVCGFKPCCEDAESYQLSVQGLSISVVCVFFIPLCVCIMHEYLYRTAASTRV